MNDIRFTKTNGGIPRPAANEDPISALIMGLYELKEDDLRKSDKEKFTILHTDSLTHKADFLVAKIQYVEQLKDFGIEYSQPVTEMSYSESPIFQMGESFATLYTKPSAFNTLIYHVTEFFRMNPNGTLYVAVASSINITADHIQMVQNYADGKIRQVGILTQTLANIADYQTVATTLERNHKPLSIVVAPRGRAVTVTAYVPSMVPEGEMYDCTNTISVTAVSDMSVETLKDATNTNVANGRANVSVLIGADLDGTLGAKLGSYRGYGCIGTCLGAISKAAVNECIAWVQKFPLGLARPGLISGEAINTVSEANQNDLNANHLIFARLHVGIADCYFNDSWTLDLDTSDYCYIERVRTIDKACRGVRANLLPYLNAPLRVDAETGKLDEPTLAFLQTTAGAALKEMEKADELSGYMVEIDPDQNVIATSTLNVVIKQVPTGVMRNVAIKIGFTTSIN